MTKEEKIEAYILRRLDEKDLKAFEEDMKNNEVLRQEVESMKTLIMGIETFQLKGKLQNLAQQYEEKETEKKGKVVSFNKLRYIAVAASVIAIASIGIWFLPDKSSDELLLSEYFYRDPGLPTKMGTSDQYSFYEGMVSYKSGDYARALEMWEDVNIGIGTDTLTYYKSMVHLNVGNWQRFMDEINKLTSESPFTDKANWYKLQAYLEQNNYEAAMEILPLIDESRKGAVESITEFLEGKNLD